MTKAKISPFRLLTNAFKSSFVNLWRNKFLSIASIVVIGIIIFIFNIILSINTTVQNALVELNKKVEISVYLQERVANNEELLNQLVEKIEKIDGVLETKFINKNDALLQLDQLHPDTVTFLKKYTIENPLPNSLTITISDPKLHNSIRDKLQTEFPNDISKVNTSNPEQVKRTETIISNILSVQNFTNQVIFWVISVFLIGGTLVIINSLNITIFSRQKELQIMRFLGASHAYIKLPYILEAVWYAVLATLASFIGIQILVLSIPEQTFAFQIWDLSAANAWEILGIELLVAVTLSILASYIALEAHLRKKLIA